MYKDGHFNLEWQKSHNHSYLTAPWLPSKYYDHTGLEVSNILQPTSEAQETGSQLYVFEAGLIWGLLKAIYFFSISLKQETTGASWRK